MGKNFKTFNAFVIKPVKRYLSLLYAKRSLEHVVN